MSSKGTSAGTKKKGKPSKAEKLRLQKEEEERKLREEEDARLLAEQLEAELHEKERLEREERERLEAKQLEHRAEELEEYRVLVEEKLAAAEKWKSELRIRAKWDRYMLCDGIPDPTIQQEINTFLSLWEQKTKEDLQSVINKSDLVLNLIQKLEFILRDTPPHELTEHEAAQYEQSILDMQEMLYRKFNSATEQLLKNATTLADIDTGNMQKVITNSNVAVCIWANLNKNPRFKGYEFLEEAIGFELPKPLALKSIAIRILHSNYDHLSHQSRTFLPAVKETEAVVPEYFAAAESHAGDWKSDDEEHKPAAESIIVTEEEVKSEGRKSSLSTKEETKTVNELHETEREETEHKAESQFGGTSEGRSPSPLHDNGPEDALDHEEEDVVDLRQFSTVGGVFYFELFELPPQCKQLNGWTIVEVYHGGLRTHRYPEDPSLSTTEPEKEADAQVSPPVVITFKVPNNVIFFEDPQVAIWDPQSKNWKLDLITQQKYKKEQREFSFSMESFYTFALIQDSHLNMPYQSWELKPKNMDEVTMTIISAFTEIQIDIKGEQCSLSSVSGADSDLSNILGVWMTPLTLKTAMKTAGLNFFPEEDSKNYVSINLKNEHAESRAYKEMALLSPSFAFGWSKWNHDSGYEQIILQAKDCALSADTWSLYMLSVQRTLKMKISESSETYSEDPADHTDFHSTLYHVLKDFSSTEAVERLQNTNYLLVDCVHQLLNMTKVLTYS
ncbi:dynein axonemal intermediate chain 7 [Discoglossus pictus]